MISSHFMFFVVWKVMCQIFRGVQTLENWGDREENGGTVLTKMDCYTIRRGDRSDRSPKIGEILGKIWGPTKDCGCLFPHVRPNKLRSVGSWGTSIIKRQHPSDFWMGAQLRFCFDPFCTWFPASSNSGSPGTRYLATRFCTVTCPADLGPPRSG